MKNQKKLLFIVIAIFLVILVFLQIIDIASDKYYTCYISTEETAIGITKLLLNDMDPKINVDEKIYNVQDAGDRWTIEVAPSFQYDSNVIVIGGAFYFELKKDGEVIDFQVWD